MERPFFIEAFVLVYKNILYGIIKEVLGAWQPVISQGVTVLERLTSLKDSPKLNLQF